MVSRRLENGSKRPHKKILTGFGGLKIRFLAIVHRNFLPIPTIGKQFFLVGVEILKNIEFKSNSFSFI